MIKILFNIVIGIGLILVWSRFVNPGQILETISKVNLLSLLPVVICLFLSPVIRAIRLKVFLGEVRKIPLQDIIFLNLAAQMLNFFIPIRAGEIAKGIYLNTNYNLSLAKGITWVFIDRFVDFLAVLLLATLLLLVLPTSLSINFIIVIVVILTISLSLTYLAVFKIDFAKKIVSFLRFIFIEKHIKLYFDKFSHFILESFSILDRHPKDLSLMVIITIFAYGADAAIWYFTFISLNHPQQYLKMYLGQLLSALTYLIPAAPGYVGSAEASGLLVLSGIFGIEPNLASAMTVLSHLLTVICVLIFGLIAIFFLKLDLGLILRKALRKN